MKQLCNGNAALAVAAIIIVVRPNIRATVSCIISVVISAIIFGQWAHRAKNNVTVVIVSFV